jgi:AcrR family transcriptional regulator
MPRDTDLISSSVWMRPARSRKGPRPSLSREQIVRAAVELLDAEGLTGLSMRRLGAKLGSGATSVYWYVANKDELLDLAFDEVLGEVDIPDANVEGWRSAADAMARSLRAVILRHTWISSLYGVRPAIGPNAMRFGERLLQVLTTAGFKDMELAHASTVLMSHTIGAATTNAALHTASTRSGKSATELVRQLDPYIDRIAGEYPSYGKWWSEHRDLDVVQLQEDAFTFGLDRLLDGLESWLHSED